MTYQMHHKHLPNVREGHTTGAVIVLAKWTDVPHGRLSCQKLHTLALRDMRRVPVREMALVKRQSKAESWVRVPGRLESRIREER